MTTVRVTTVLVVDRHRAYAEALTIALDQFEGIQALPCAVSVQDAALPCAKGLADVVLMDWDRPATVGLDDVRRLRESGKSVAVIMARFRRCSASPRIQRGADD